MKILYLIDSLTTGGAEILLCNFIKEYKHDFPDSKHYIITLNKDISLLPSIKEYIEGIETIAFNERRVLFTLWVLKKSIKKIKPDLIHAHLFYSTMLGRLASGKSIPVISSYHNMEYCKESPYYSFKYPLIDKLTFNPKRHFCIYVSNAVKTCVQHGVPSQIHHSAVISNFVPNEFKHKYNFCNIKKLKLISVGNLKKVKNHLFVLKEISSLADLNITLDIYGEGEMHNELKEFIQSHSLKVRLMGKGNITSDLLCQYDAFLLPSLSEGMPISLIEAIVSGLPSFISDLAQLKETAENTALYFSPTQPGTLSALLKQVYEKKQILIDLSENTKVIGAKYRWKHHYEAIEKVYKNCLSKNQNFDHQYVNN